MKKQNKKANTIQPKRLQLDKTIISSFDAKQVKGGTARTTAARDWTAETCIQWTGQRDCI